MQNLENRLEELNLQRQQLVAERAIAVQNFENRNQPVFAFRATRGAGPLRRTDPFRPIPRDFTPEGFPQSLSDIAREELIDEVDEQIKQLGDDLLLVKRLLEQTGASLEGLGNEADEAAKKIDKLTAALLALRRTSDQAKLSIETARLEQQQTLGIVGVEEYFRRRKELRDQDLENELAYQRRIIDTTTDAVERAKAEGEVIKLLAKARIEDLQDITQLVLKLQEIERAGAQVRIQALRLEGELEEAKRQELIEQFRARRDQLIREGDLEGAGLIDKIIDTEVLRANLDEALLEVERFQGQISNLTGQVDLNVELGALTQRAGQLQTADIYQQLIDKFQELTKEGITLEQKLQEIVDTGTDPELVASAQKWLTVLANARGQVELLTNEWIQFEQNVRDAATDSLANYFADAVIEAENLGDALRSLGDIRSLLADLITQIIQLTTRMLALKIIESIPTFAAGGGEVVAKAQGGLIGYDGGGKVRGPGGPTADKVPALLSNGEYVIKTASVRKYGADFFSKLNAGIFPRSFRGYAEGGMVGALAQTNDLTSTDSEGLKGELQVGLSDGLVLRDMDSPAGRRFILKVIQENRRSVAQSLGAG